MNVAIINQFGPPDESPTACLAGDLAMALEANGHGVSLITGPPGYRNRQRGVLRIISEGGAWCRLLARSVRQSGIDCWIVFSSPPLVVWVALIAAQLRGGKVLHWVLDAYPDIGLALGALPAGGIYGFLKNCTRRAYEKCFRVVAVSQGMKEYLSREYQLKAEVIHPWPVKLEAGMIRLPERMLGVSRTWIYSGNLGRAHDWESLIRVQERLEQTGSDWRLILQGGGSGWEAARRDTKSRGLKNVEFRSYVPADELLNSLLAADVRVVTCREEVSGLLWPSKLALLRAMSGPHLYIGPELPDPDLPDEMTCFTPGQIDEIREWLQQLGQTSRPASGTMVEDSVDLLRSRGVTFWKGLVELRKGSS